jgi:hypothetical protein
VSGRSAARAIGACFVVLGLAGLVPGVTAHYGDLRFASGSHAQLIGVFRVSVLLNLVHILVGVVGIASARLTEPALASLALWLLGTFAAGGLMSLDTADNWLHFVLGVGLLGLGSLAVRSTGRTATA